MHAILIPLLLAVAAAAPPEKAPDIVVVCPEEFRAAMDPWVTRRTEQGHIIKFVSNLGSAADVRGRIQEVSDQRELKFVLLVGTASLPTQNLPVHDPGAPSDWCPTFSIPAKMDVYWGGGPEFASDNPYADLDGDGLTDIAVGRLPARTSDDLAAMIKKILAFEDSRDYGPWRSKINFVAGQAGFGAVGDSLIETAARKAITWGIPGSYTTSLTNACWSSPNCPDPHLFHQHCLEGLNEPSLFWVYMGHGSPRELQWAQFPDGGTPTLSCDDAPTWHCAATPPIAIFLACYTGMMGQPSDCLSAELVRNPEGPVAVFSGSSVTMPYGMTMLGWEIMQEYFDKHQPTLGELIMHAKRDTMAGYDRPLWGLVDALTVALAPASFHPKEERREHVQLFNLFGDPTMLLHYPRPIVIDAPTQAASGEHIRVTGQCPIAGSGTLELVLRRDRLPDGIAARDRYNSSDVARQQFEKTYLAANNLQLSAIEVRIAGGQFEAELLVPESAHGSCHVRMFVTGESECALVLAIL